MKIGTIIAAVSCAAFAAPVQPAAAYNISLKGRVHERMTAMAELCLAEAEGRFPERCDPAALAGRLPRRALQSPRARAVRWSDDPTGQISATAGLKFLAQTLGGGCEKRIPANASPADPPRPFAGLLCHTHYGSFQFMHALSGRAGETPQDTAAKMLSWADLTYRVATGRIGREVGYCDYLRKQKAIAAELAPPSFPFCEADRAEEASDPYSRWRVHTLFSMRCRNPLSSKKCSEAIGDAGEAIARRNATGALLHLVQDSFSQSHVVRGEPQAGRKFKPLVVCAPATAYHVYRLQTAAKIKHSSADKQPAWDSGCAGSAIHDPVTASAVLLWHIDNPSSPEAVAAYIRTHVLGI
jgi:hypothetical protein